MAARHDRELRTIRTRDCDPTGDGSALARMLHKQIAARHKPNSRSLTPASDRLGNCVKGDDDCRVIAIGPLSGIVAEDQR